MKTQCGNVTGNLLLLSKCKNNNAGPVPKRIKVLAISHPQEIRQKSYWAWTNREAYEHASVQFVVHWMQRNLSPMASLQLHTNIYSVSGKEKTPHLRISQALNLTFWALTSNVRGRRTFSFRHFYIYFCENRNI